MLMHVRNVDPDEILFRSRALRDASICMAWCKMMSVIWYISLFFLVKLNSIGDISFFIQILTLVAMVLVVLQGGMLFLGVLQESHCAVAMAMFLSMFMATYDLMLGSFVAIFYIIIGNKTMDYVICVAFALLAVSFFPTMCHDVFIMNKYRKTLVEIYGSV